jgi:hypothetical protein
MGTAARCSHILFTSGDRRELSRRPFSSDVVLDSEAVLHAFFEGQQEDTGQTRLKMLKDDSASRRGVAVAGVAPLTQGRGYQQGRSVYLLIAKGLRPTEIT